MHLWRVDLVQSPKVLLWTYSTFPHHLQSDTFLYTLQKHSWRHLAPNKSGWWHQQRATWMCPFASTTFLEFYTVVKKFFRTMQHPSTTQGHNTNFLVSAFSWVAAGVLAVERSATGGSYLSALHCLRTTERPGLPWTAFAPLPSHCWTCPLEPKICEHLQKAVPLKTQEMHVPELMRDVWKYYTESAAYGSEWKKGVEEGKKDKSLELQKYTRNSWQSQATTHRFRNRSHLQ